MESKIYREDELENRLAELGRELDRRRARPPPTEGSTETSHSRTSSVHTAAEDRCELCEGPHELDACPVFAGNTLGGGHGEGEGKPSPLAGRGKVGKLCADCEVRP